MHALPFAWCAGILVALSGCARGVAPLPLSDGGEELDGRGDAGPENACARGAVEVCPCADGGMGFRSCEQDADSPSFGFFTACVECVFPGDGSPDQDGADGSHCTDGRISADESDQDCGGSCPACAVGRACATPSDCASGVCQERVCAPGPSFRNFDASAYAHPRPTDWSCAGTTRFDSTGQGSFMQATSCSTEEAQRPAFTCGVAQTTAGGPPVCILHMRGFKLGEQHVLELTGDKPVILSVQGDAEILGVISADALGILPGPGGNQGCDEGTGRDGAGSFARLAGASGGGGGGLGTMGGAGGAADTDGTLRAGGAGGAVHGDSEASPLLGGCPGGKAGGCTGEPGAGGGGIQIAATGLLTVRGTVSADGGPGSTPCGGADEGGGTGGGSGGTVLLEAARLDLQGATLRAQGGAGGRSGSYAGVFACGNSAGGVGASGVDMPGADGVSCQGGGSGGGGGSGRVVTD